MSSFTKENLNSLYRLVKSYLKKTAPLEANHKDKQEQYGYISTPEYRFQHTMKVLDYALQIGSQEGGSSRVLLLAALFHDLERFTCPPLEHGQRGAISTSRILLERGYDPQLVERVHEAIYYHVGQQELHSLSLEGAIIVEADRLDKFGSKGMMVNLMISGINGLNFKESLASFQEHLIIRGKRNLKIFRTETGSRMLREKMAEQEEFLESLQAGIILETDSFFQELMDNLSDD